MKRNKHLKVVGNLKDRGTIKWQGLMLPEHMELLRQWYAEDKQDKKPDLDEFDIQMIQEELNLAMQRKCTVKMKSWKEKKFHYHIGTIEKMDASSRSVVYADPYGEHRLPFDEIVAVMMID